MRDQSSPLEFHVEGSDADGMDERARSIADRFYGQPVTGFRIHVERSGPFEARHYNGLGDVMVWRMDYHAFVEPESEPF